MLAIVLQQLDSTVVVRTLITKKSSSILSIHSGTAKQLGASVIVRKSQHEMLKLSAKW